MKFLLLLAGNLLVFCLILALNLKVFHLSRADSLVCAAAALAIYSSAESDLRTLKERRAAREIKSTAGTLTGAEGLIPPGHSIVRKQSTIQAIKFTGENRADVLIFLIGRVKSCEVANGNGSSLALKIDGTDITLNPGDRLVRTGSGKVIAMTGDQYDTLFGSPAAA